MFLVETCVQLLLPWNVLCQATQRFGLGVFGASM
jgi:hypothetical protein